jgi:hypothetical protein
MALNIYIDSDVMVASEIKGEPNHLDSKKFMDFVIKSKRSNITFFTSIFTFLELTSAMIRRTRKPDKTYSLLYRVRNSWKKFINPLPPTEKLTSFTGLIDELIETSIKFRTPAGDTIHAHTFAKNDMNYLITWNSKHFSGMKRKIKNIKILTPTDVLKEFEKLEKKSTKKSSEIFNDVFLRFIDERNKAVHNLK